MIRAKTEPEEIVIDLTGPDGNAYAMIGYAKTFARQLGLESEPIIKEMCAGDYEHLLATFEKHFGEYVILER